MNLLFLSVFSVLGGYYFIFNHPNLRHLTSASSAEASQNKKTQNKPIFKSSRDNLSRFIKKTNAYCRVPYAYKNKPISNPIAEYDRGIKTLMALRSIQDVEATSPEVGSAQKESSGKEEPAALFQVEVPGIRRRRRVMFYFFLLLFTMNSYPQFMKL